MAKKRNGRKYTHVEMPTRIDYNLSAERYNKIADYVNARQEIIYNYSFQTFLNECTDLKLNHNEPLNFQVNTQIEQIREQFNEFLILIKEKEKKLSLLSSVVSEASHFDYEEDSSLEKAILALLPITYPSLCKNLNFYEKQDIFQALIQLEQKSKIYLNTETMKWCKNKNG